MQLKQIAAELELSQVTKLDLPSVDVQAGYVSDLLSNVMGQAGENYIWVTMQGHPNISAIGSLLSLAAIVVAGGANVEAETIEKANENMLCIFKTELSSFDIVGKLYALGIKGHE